MKQLLAIVVIAALGVLAYFLIAEERLPWQTESPAGPGADDPARPGGAQGGEAGGAGGVQTRPPVEVEPGSALLMELSEAPAQAYGAPTWAESDRKYRDVLRPLSGVTYDPALGHAARELAVFYSQHKKLAPSGVLHFVLDAAGAAEWGVLQSYLTTSQTEDAAILERVRNLMARPQRSRGKPRVGVGEAYAIGPRTERVVAVVVSRGELVLERVPRRVERGREIVIRGLLPPGATDPKALWVGPDLAFKTVEPSLSGERFTFRIQAPAQTGPVSVELLATMPYGPTPLAQLEIWVGEDPAEIFEGQWPPDESEIDDHWAAEASMLDLLDDDRARYDLPQLKHDELLRDIARAHSEDMAKNDFFGHHSPTTGSLSDRIRAAGYPAVGMAENLASNISVWDAEEGLFHSLGHRKNILAKDLTHVGVGAASVMRGDKRQWLLTQVFAKPATALDAARARAEVLQAINTFRAKKGLDGLEGHAKLDEVAAAQAGREGVSPRTVLDAASERGLLRRGGSAWVGTMGEMGQFEVPEAAADERYRKVGIGLSQDLEASPPRLTIVVLLGA